MSWMGVFPSKPEITSGLKRVTHQGSKRLLNGIGMEEAVKNNLFGFLGCVNVLVNDVR
ncbi:hypothetical protein Cflav_PD2903 [Pedosphaera parvula Ellin514]|uniref:Uncharacterized protein n=1 Tax=Pedosphaera parvula (strain Ellin514) TaxID=320771 RepID=B9XMK2_PEDPL|nr:hypothetical protein Cflav_PD2903 [Pedosphaera parvula Ellin514]